MEISPSVFTYYYDISDEEERWELKPCIDNFFCRNQDTLYRGVRPCFDLPTLSSKFNGQIFYCCRLCAVSYTAKLKVGCCKESSFLVHSESCRCGNIYLCLACVKRLREQGYKCDDCTLKDFGQYTKPVKR